MASVDNQTPSDPVDAPPAERDAASDAERQRDAWRPERFARALLDGAGEGIVVFDAELRFRAWNRFMEERTGLAAADLIGLHADALLDRWDGCGSRAFVEQALAGECVTSTDHQLRSPSGRLAWYSCRFAPYRDESGTIVGVIGHLRDTTERRESEERLRASEAQLRAIVEGASDLVVILDARGRVTYVSPAVTAILGIPPAELSGTEPLDRVHPDDRAQALAAFLSVVRSPEHPRRVQYRARHADGTWRTLLTWARNLLDEPAVRGIVTSSRDVTEWQELQGRLHQSQRIEAVGRLAGGVAHDYNNLLTVINANARMLLADAGPAAPGRDELEEIAQAAERATTLTRQLLAFSRQQVLQPRMLDLNEVVRGMWKLLERLAGDAVRAEARLANSLGTVLADPVQVEQVLINLAVNARDAMPDGGALVVETSDVWVDEEEAARHPPMLPGDYVLLAVHDTGVGMDQETLARAFEPFFTTKPLGQGTGMGLSTVYGIVKQSGGFLWAVSAPGKGASFRVYLPRLAEPATRVPEEPVATSRGGGSETIIVAEDEPLVRAVTRRTLERAGYQVLVAADGAEALGLVRALGSSPQLLITDIVMPVMGGRELAATIEREHPTTKILYMSGYTNEARAYIGSEDGAVSRFLQKPFSQDELRLRVRSLLDEAPASA